MRKLFAGLIAALVMVTASASALAEGHNSQATLGSGGREVVIAECPAGEVLTGFTGRTGAGIDRIQIVCAAMLADGSFGAPHPFRDAYGGFGGGETPIASCDRNSRIAQGRVGLVPAGNMVGGVGFVCVDGNGGVTSRGVFGAVGSAGPVAYRDRCRDTFMNAITPGCREGATADYRCPDESFTGIRVRFDTAVRGIGFLCDVRNPPAPPPRPVRSSGRPKPASGPPVATGINLIGAWNTVTGQNGHFLVVLQIANSVANPILEDIYVTGQLINSDGAPQYNGTLRGIIPRGTRTLTYEFVQPESKNSGRGQFTLSPDGNSISGTGNQSNGEEIIWNGTRAK